MHVVARRWLLLNAPKLLFIFHPALSSLPSGPRSPMLFIGKPHASGESQDAMLGCENVVGCAPEQSSQNVGSATLAANCAQTNFQYAVAVRTAGVWCEAII